MKLSVVMPVYNEQATLAEVIARVLAVPLEIELICVDDGSRDGSREILQGLQASHPQIRVLFQPTNMGKGAALRRGIQESTGDYVIIRTPIWNTIPPNIHSFSDRFSRTKPMWFTDRDSSGPAPTASSIFGTRSATPSSL